MICLETITDKKRFWNIYQKYLYEMTQFYHDEMDEQGNYPAKFFNSYFEGDAKRKAVYIMNENTLIGFALINNYSHIGNDIDYAIAEFTIFPSYRKHGYGYEAVKLIFHLFAGQWEIKYNIGNHKAVIFWSKLTEIYAPKVVKLNDEEKIISFSTASNQ